MPMLRLTIALACLLPALAAAQEYHRLPPEPPQPGPVREYAGTCGRVRETLELSVEHQFRLHVEGGSAPEELQGRWRQQAHGIILVGALQEARYAVGIDGPEGGNTGRTVLSVTKIIRWSAPPCTLVATDSSGPPPSLALP